jgi:hypothetical protein
MPENTLRKKKKRVFMRLRPGARVSQKKLFLLSSGKN